MAKFSEVVVSNRKILALLIIIILEVICFFYFKPSVNSLPVTIVKYKGKEFAKKYKHLSGDEIQEVILNNNIQAKTAVFAKVERPNNPLTTIKGKNGEDLDIVKRKLSDKEIQSILKRYPNSVGPGYALRHTYKTKVYIQEDYEKDGRKEVLKIFDGKLTNVEVGKKMNYLVKMKEVPACDRIYEHLKFTQVINLETKKVVEEVPDGHFSEKELIDKGIIDRLIQAKEISKGYFVIYTYDGVETDIYCNSEKIETVEGNISDTIFEDLKKANKIKMIDIKNYEYKHDIENIPFPVLDWVACAFALPFAIIFLFQYISEEEEKKMMIDRERIMNSPGKIFLFFDYMQSTTSFACITALLGTFAVWASTKSITWVAAKGFELANKLVIPVIVAIVVVVILLIIAKVIASIFIAKYYYQAEVELAKLRGPRESIKAIENKSHLIEVNSHPQIGDDNFEK